MKYILISLTVMSMLFYGCKNTVKTAEHDHDHDHATEQADHKDHKDHKDHDHTGEHKHEAGEGKHDHEGENHEGHDHTAENHDGHDHTTENADEHDHGKEAEEQEHSDEIVFTKAQAAKTEFEVKEIQPKNFYRVIKTTGQILPAPGDESVIVATNSGTVSFADNRLTEGSAVKQGQPLFSIASKNMGEGDYYSKVFAAYEKAKAEYERAEILVKDKIISQKEYENTRLNYQNAKIAYDAVSGKQSAKGMNVTAPIGGYIKNITVKDGEYVTAGQMLGTVSQNRRLVLRAEVSEKHYKALNTICNANFKTPYDNRVYALSDLKGRLLSIGKTAGENSFFVPVSFEFDNRGDIVPGAFVEVFLESTPLANVITVPVSALTNEMGIFYVYVQIDAEGYRKQEVKTGAGNGNEIQILNGLKPGDRVVTKGAYQVKMASASGAIPHGHEH